MLYYDLNMDFGIRLINLIMMGIYVCGPNIVALVRRKEAMTDKLVRLRVPHAWLFEEKFTVLC
jgi:hypothetical protein